MPLSELPLIASLLVLSGGLSISMLTKRNHVVLLASAISLAIVTAFTRGLSLAFSILVALLTVLAALVMSSVRESIIRGVDVALITLIGLSAILSIEPLDFVRALTLFVVSSVSTYILVIIGPNAVDAANAMAKYVAFMIIGTVLFILGACVLILSCYGAPNPLLYVIGVCILVSGLAVEIGAAPFHQWVPDVYALADPIPVATIASIAKFVPVIVALKILMSASIELPESLMYATTMFVAAIATISMFVGSIGGLTSIELSRVLAYSTILNMGYILSALVAVLLTRDPHVLTLAIAGIILQLFTNGFGKVFYFPILKTGGTSPALTWLTTLSFWGTPPLLGFWPKLFIILALTYVNMIWLVIVLIVNAIMSVPYYFRLARVLGGPWRRDLISVSVLVAAAAVLITLFPPNWLIDLVQSSLTQFSLALQTI